MARPTVDTIRKTMRDFNRWVLGCMDERHLTQDIVADRMGISQQTFSYRKTHQNWSVEDMLRLEEIFEERWRE